MSISKNNWYVDIDGNRILANDARKTIICHLSASYKNSEVAADAHLISAAPDLLQLLIESQTSIGGDWRERRDAAVAKATGKST